MRCTLIVDYVRIIWAWVLVSIYLQSTAKGFLKLVLRPNASLFRQKRDPMFSENLETLCFVEKCNFTSKKALIQIYSGLQHCNLLSVSLQKRVKTRATVDIKFSKPFLLYAMLVQCLRTLFPWSSRSCVLFRLILNIWIFQAVSHSICSFVNNKF